jgi:Amt family ammonium transporter
MLMIPGLGYFYSGMARHKNALSLIFLSMLSLCVVMVQWFIFGFSISFSPEGGPFIGTLKYSFFVGIADKGTWVYPGTHALIR